MFKILFMSRRNALNYLNKSVCRQNCSNQTVMLWMKPKYLNRHISNEYVSVMLLNLRNLSWLSNTLEKLNISFYVNTKIFLK